MEGEPMTIDQAKPAIVAAVREWPPINAVEGEAGGEDAPRFFAWLDEMLAINLIGP